MSDARKKKDPRSKERGSISGEEAKPNGDRSMEELTRLRAYELYETRTEHGADGSELDDWCRAEEQILEEYGS